MLNSLRDIKRWAGAVTAASPVSHPNGLLKGHQEGGGPRPFSAEQEQPTGHGSNLSVGGAWTPPCQFRWLILQRRQDYSGQQVRRQSSNLVVKQSFQHGDPRQRLPGAAPAVLQQARIAKPARKRADCRAPTLSSTPGSTTPCPPMKRTTTTKYAKTSRNGSRPWAEQQASGSM